MSNILQPCGTPALIQCVSEKTSVTHNIMETAGGFHADVKKEQVASLNMNNNVYNDVTVRLRVEFVYYSILRLSVESCGRESMQMNELQCTKNNSQHSIYKNNISLHLHKTVYNFKSNLQLLSTQPFAISLNYF